MGSENLGFLVGTLDFQFPFPTELVKNVDFTYCLSPEPFCNILLEDKLINNNTKESIEKIFRLINICHETNSAMPSWVVYPAAIVATLRFYSGSILANFLSQLNRDT